MWNPNDFIGRKEAVIKYFSKNSITEDSIAEYCSLAGIPITVVCTFLIEAYPENKKLLNEKIRAVNEFYGIKEKTCGTCTRFCGNEWCVTRSEK